MMRRRQKMKRSQDEEIPGRNQKIRRRQNWLGVVARREGEPEEREETVRGAEAGMRLCRERSGRNGVRNKLGKTVRG